MEHIKFIVVLLLTITFGVSLFCNINFFQKLYFNDQTIAVTKTIKAASNIVHILNKYKIPHIRFEEFNGKQSNLEEMESYIPICITFHTLKWNNNFNLLIDRLHYEFLQRAEVNCLHALMTTEPNTIAGAFAVKIIERIQIYFTENRTLLQKILGGKKFLLT